MNDTFINILHILYWISIPLILSWFLLQVVKILKTKKANDISIGMLIIWSITTTITLLYDIYVLWDIKVIIVWAGQFLICIFILLLVIKYEFFNKSKYIECLNNVDLN